VWLTASPDSAWWIYGGDESNDDYPTQKVIAYNVTTGEMITFSEGVSLPFRANFYEPASAWFVWSPIFSSQGATK